MDQNNIIESATAFLDGLEKQLKGAETAQEQTYSSIQSQKTAPTISKFLVDKMETEYWALDKKIRDLRVKTEAIVTAIIQAMDGNGSVDSLIELLPQEFFTIKGNAHVSKRKAAVEEFRRKLLSGRPLAELSLEERQAYEHPPKAPTRFLGRGGTNHFHDVADSFNAAAMFFSRTVQSHGGKIRGGSSAGEGVYIGRGGKRIRKF
ncbi:MAG: hypothetical protein UV75_C0004G0018 [Candidatus Giovannonibacteria bacterium GW2011_GWA1_43_15]|nr:MAG: hypothetical protein UV72_C0005G0018 [Candidatus Giovannonibacteria bacterium GW2011_GWB1_43_13]KKS99464.1 MAG: hypothetical protein UV75_C0004G0018 [Candidatus Giovannonibacteria bacterium GW2011_GWA1_43_15]KKT20867.1 MAG: hypothetical protein UW05_C0025G0003 [Candidatus Giovannonibacteria bacterium GW2011_GWC2_43_8]KKT63385.1 MAG: hypothetical protein UW55_C0004G0018 [Candidatus Giovannonibacteria bacterium GW2011_GWA2_44_26]OGF85738.1 MAG: hypothetical protein A3I28_00150 [Candidatus